MELKDGLPIKFKLDMEENITLLKSIPKYVISIQSITIKSVRVLFLTKTINKYMQIKTKSKAVSKDKAKTKGKMRIIDQITVPLTKMVGDFPKNSLCRCSMAQK